jgi:hypothetical protein
LICIVHSRFRLTEDALAVEGGIQHWFQSLDDWGGLIVAYSKAKRQQVVRWPGDPGHLVENSVVYELHSLVAKILTYNPEGYLFCAASWAAL